MNEDRPEDRARQEFSAFYEAHHTELQIIVRYRLLGAGVVNRNPEIAEDIVAEAFLRCWKMWDHPVESRKGYLIAIARNLVSSGYAGTPEASLSDRHRQWMETSAGHAVDPNVQAVLLEQIPKLRPRLRQVIALILQGLEPEEIAAQLQIKVTTVYDYRSEAVEALRTALRRAETGPSRGRTAAQRPPRAPQPDRDHNGGA
ncbi:MULTISPECIES: RNA polymerase sigma factor [unclassified Crossiella]|uniref:RNA polymerase sigma factor n=1 Tax=unclassified Crossiella TaxID=2620835 RepID=UPI001FFEE897|nr:MULTISPECIES: RNA polymerase sigma factor [unclassified Crossiella]MCK2243658.1 RNA polymerase sigma factor [Crossiella sp. S99.2]MCK2257516.1 RNA polymerase sigma factor [Crossiella sp. S99.1]